HDHRTRQLAVGNLVFEHCGDAPNALHRHADLFRRCRGEGLEYARRDWQHRCCSDQHRGQRRRRQYFPPTHDAPPGTVFARAEFARPGNDLIRRRRLGTCFRMKMIKLELPGVEVSTATARGRMAARYPRRQCRVWVKLRRTQYEQMSSAVPTNSGVARCGRHVANVPILLRKLVTADGCPSAIRLLTTGFDLPALTLVTQRQRYAMH